MNTQKVLLAVGLGFLGYYAFRVLRLAGTLHDNPAAGTTALGEAVRSQGLGMPLVAVGALGMWYVRR